MTPTDPFEEGEQTLIRTDRHHRQDPEEPAEDFEQEEIEKPQETSERSEVEAKEELWFKGTSKSETKSNSRRKEHSSLVKQGKNAMMSSISVREEQPGSKAKRSFKTMYDERMASLRTGGLSSGYDQTKRGWCTQIWTSTLAQDRRRVRSRCPVCYQDQCQMG